MTITPEECHTAINALQLAIEVYEKKASSELRSPQLAAAESVEFMWANREKANHCKALIEKLEEQELRQKIETPTTGE